MTKAAAKAGGNTLHLYAKKGEKPKATMARGLLEPGTQAALTAYALLTPSYADLELSPLVDELADQVKATNSGDMARMEAMLTTQAHTLDVIFNTLARRAVANMGPQTNTAESSDLCQR